MSFGIENLHMCTTKQSCWRSSRISSYLKGRTTWSGKRSGEECRSGDGHLEWPPRIVEIIHSRNVFQKEVITFIKLWEKEEALPIRREDKMGAFEDPALTIQRRSLKQWGIWRNQILKNLLSTQHLDKKRCDYEWRRRWSWRLKKESTLETNKDKYSIVISWYSFVMHLFIFSYCIIHDRMFALMTVYY